MKTIELSNARCRVLLTPEQGGRVTSLRTLSPRGEGVEHVGPNHLQLWLKAGDPHDPAAGMLHLFHGTLHQQPAAATPAPLACEFTQTADGVTFRKRFTLDPALPVLDIHASVTNDGKEPLNLQVECSFNWSFGAAGGRPGVLTSVIFKDKVQHLHLPPYGDVCVDTYDADGAALALSDAANLETLLLRAHTNWKRFTIYQAAGSNWRGPYSNEKTLGHGETLQAGLQLAIVSGAAGLDTLAGDPAVGLLADRGVWFTDEPITATASAARLTGAAAGVKMSCEVAAGSGRERFMLETGSVPYTGASRRVTLPAGSLGPGVAAVEGRFDGKTLRAPIRVLDPDADAGAPLVRRAAKPTFPVRAIHLILSQQSIGAALTIDAMKWFVENVVAPCGFTHAVWEFNGAIKLRSRPELASPVSFSAAQVAGLARFCRSLDVEPIPQQNLFGHQHETNLTTVYPELQEIPGEPAVYCPNHPRTRAIVNDIVAELLDVFDARLFHMGHDEVQFQGMPQKVGVCPRCRQSPPHEVFAADVNAIWGVAQKRGARCIVWGDMLIPPACGGPNVNGLMGEVHRALDLIPRETIIADWHYYPSENYQSTNYFHARGHEVWDAVWFNKEGIRRLSLHADYAHSPGMIFTTWCRPDVASVPLEPMLYAAQCFQDIDSASEPGGEERRRIAAHRLWRRWRRAVEG